ncbi:MAG: winged helix-turn-helix domain-containing protein [Chloroflexota bacterium]
MSKKPAIQLDSQTGRILHNGRYLRVPPLEYNLLRYFLENPNARLTKSDIINNVWPDDVCREGVTDDALYRLIYSTRSCLAREAPDVNYIETWRGQPEGGYIFSPGEVDSAFKPLAAFSKLSGSDGSLDAATLHELARQMQLLADSLLVVSDGNNGRYDPQLTA